MDKQTYTDKLQKALIKVSEQKLDPKIAQQVAEEYVQNLKVKITPTSLINATLA